MTSRVKKALEHVDMEIIYDIYECEDFVEIKGETGGDVMCDRVYFDGDEVDYVCAK